MVRPRRRALMANRRAQSCHCVSFAQRPSTPGFQHVGRCGERGKSAQSWQKNGRTNCAFDLTFTNCKLRMRRMPDWRRLATALGQIRAICAEETELIDQCASSGILIEHSSLIPHATKYIIFAYLIPHATSFVVLKTTCHDRLHRIESHLLRKPSIGILLCPESSCAVRFGKCSCAKRHGECSHEGPSPCK